jgi:hypothetical protein
MNLSIAAVSFAATIRTIGRRFAAFASRRAIRAESSRIAVEGTVVNASPIMTLPKMRHLEENVADAFDMARAM